jgi:hypothetical protein
MPWSVTMTHLPKKKGTKTLQELSHVRHSKKHSAKPAMSDCPWWPQRHGAQSDGDAHHQHHQSTSTKRVQTLKRVHYTPVGCSAHKARIWIFFNSRPPELTVSKEEKQKAERGGIYIRPSPLPCLSVHIALGIYLMRDANVYYYYASNSGPKYNIHALQHDTTARHNTQRPLLSLCSVFNTLPSTWAQPVVTKRKEKQRQEEREVFISGIVSCISNLPHRFRYIFALLISITTMPQTTDQNATSTHSNATARRPSTTHNPMDRMRFFLFNTLH